jgi:hypothetical protein
MSLHAGDIIDRIVATVNKNVILQSDLEDSVQYERFMAGEPLSKLTQADYRSALERLIDQELLRQQMASLQLASPTAMQVDARIAELRKLYPGAENEQTWQRILKEYGITETGLRGRVAREIALMHFVDLRLRPSVHVARGEIESYYRDQFLPKLKQAGGGEAPLEQVSDKIERILEQQRVDELLNSWLKDLREQADIHMQQESSPSAGAPVEALR